MGSKRTEERCSGALLLALVCASQHLQSHMLTSQQKMRDVTVHLAAVRAENPRAMAPKATLVSLV